MPRFTPNLRDASAGILLLDDGDYEFSLGQPKLFSRNKKDGSPVYGVSYGLTITKGPSNVGKSVPQQIFLHNEGALGMSKRFAMAALGFNPNDPTEELDFNTKYEDVNGDDFGIDPDTAFIGTVWARAGGSTIAATVKQQMSKPQDGSEPRLQNNFTWRTIK